MKQIFYSLIAVFSVSVSAQIPTGYYNNATGTGATLKTNLKNIITAGHSTNISYGDLWTAYQTTDRDKYYEGDNSILDIYSESSTNPDSYNYRITTDQCGGNGYSGEGDCYNREHIVPQSLFNEQLPMKSDVHFIRATDGKVNGERGNFPFGLVGTPTYQSLNGSKRGNSISAGYSQTVFEPIDEFKGDVARMIFYFVTRYENQLSSFASGDMLGNSAYPGLQTWELNQLLAWHNQDPVSLTEIERNNRTYIFQGNRNPYIDNPNFANLVWNTAVTETQAPTSPTNLTVNNITSNSVVLNWTASTDNVGVSGYIVYVNGVLYPTSATNSSTIVNLNPSTVYSFAVIAQDAAGNLSAQSNTATITTLVGSCGSEYFDNIPAASSTYSTRSWTGSSASWTATNARTDQMITNKAITFKNGNLTSSSISGGIQGLTVTAQQKYSGNPGSLAVEINGVNVGSIPYGKNPITTTLNNLNVSGNFTIKLINSVASNAVAVDNIYWTCSTLSTSEATHKDVFVVYPNPVRNHEIFVKGENVNKITKAEIYDLSGKLVMSVANPFKDSSKISLNGLVKGSYILKTDTFSTKFIVE